MTVDGDARGKAPVVVETTAGKHLVEVAKDGYEPFARWVLVAVAGTTELGVTLTPNAPPARPPPAKRARPDRMALIPGGTDGRVGLFCFDVTEVTVDVPLRDVDACQRRHSPRWAADVAKRGAERRPNPWGADQLDRGLTHAFAGPNGAPVAVTTGGQDQTPANAQGHRIFDLIGNVQEWTVGLWREDTPGTDESWVQSGETTIRAIRGFPLTATPPASIQRDGAAYRERFCATGPCVAKGRKLRTYVGFRCAKSIERGRGTP